MSEFKSSYKITINEEGCDGSIYCCSIRTPSLPIGASTPKSEVDAMNPEEYELVTEEVFMKCCSYILEKCGKDFYCPEKATRLKDRLKGKHRKYFSEEQLNLRMVDEPSIMYDKQWVFCIYYKMKLGEKMDEWYKLEKRIYNTINEFIEKSKNEKSESETSELKENSI